MARKEIALSDTGQVKVRISPVVIDHLSKSAERRGMTFNGYVAAVLSDRQRSDVEPDIAELCETIASVVRLTKKMRGAKSWNESKAVRDACLGAVSYVLELERHDNATARETREAIAKLTEIAR